MSDISVVVVSYNTRDYLHACLLSVPADGAGQVVVVDNGSRDGSVEMVRERFPRMVLIANTGNGGYGAAANQAVARCSTPYVLLLNADTQLVPGALDALASYLDRHPEVAVAGPRLVNEDGSHQPSCFPFPAPLYTFLELSNLSTAIRYLPVVRERYPRTWRHDRSRRVPYVLGAALALRRTAFDAVGGFDESLFMYSEESDLCYRLAERGWQTHFTPVATIAHVGGASTRQYRPAMVTQLFTGRINFYRRHYSTRRQATLVIIFAIGVTAKLVRDALHLAFARDHARRARLREDVSIWWRVLRSLNPTVAARAGMARRLGTER